MFTGKFTYAKYLEACLNEDYDTLAKNYQKVDNFNYVYTKKRDECCEAFYKGGDRRKGLKDFFKGLTTSDDGLEDFAGWLAYYAYEDFIADPESEFTKDFFENYRSDSDDPRGLGCMELFEMHIMDKMDTENQVTHKEIFDLDEDSTYDYEKGFEYYIKNYLTEDN